MPRPQYDPVFYQYGAQRRYVYDWRGRPFPSSRSARSGGGGSGPGGSGGSAGLDGVSLLGTPVVAWLAVAGAAYVGYRLLGKKRGRR